MFSFTKGDGVDDRYHYHIYKSLVLKMGKKLILNVIFESMLLKAFHANLLEAVVFLIFSTGGLRSSVFCN